MSAPLTIALALDDSLDRPDGVQQHVLTLGRWLSGRGHDVHYLAPSTARQDLGNLHVVGGSVGVRANGNVLRTPTVPRTRDLDDVLRRVQADVLHVALPCSPLLGGRLAVRAAAGTAVVGTFHIVPATRAIAVGARVLGVAQRAQMRRFDRLVSVSEPARAFARTAFGMDSAVVPNPVDVALFTSGDRDAAVPGPVEVVFLGRLVERKGPRQLVRAVAEIRRRQLARLPFRVTIAGDGPLADDLRRDVRRAGLEDVVRFRGFVPENGKVALLAGADVLVLPSTAGESFGISVVEALAAANGVVLAGDNPGYRSVMAGLEQQLVAADDPARFAEQLASWIDAPGQRDAAVAPQQARAAVFDVARVGAALLSIYRDALRGRGRSVPEAEPEPERWPRSSPPAAIHPDAYRQGRPRQRAAGRIVVEDGDVPVVRLTGAIEPRMVAEAQTVAARVRGLGRSVTIDASELDGLDSASAAVLMELVTACDALGLLASIRYPDRPPITSGSAGPAT